MSSLLASATSGLEAASTTMSVSANNVANAATAGFVPSQTSLQALASVGSPRPVVPGEDPQVESSLRAPWSPSRGPTW